MEFAGPRVDDQFTVEVIEVGEYPGFEFILGCGANVAEHRSRFCQRSRRSGLVDPDCAAI
jgi:hypothetical protein